jgi:hypothetical protein
VAGSEPATNGAKMAASAPLSELSGRCPQIVCGELIGLSTDPLRQCPDCRRDLMVCPACKATNRLLVTHCRGCGLGLDTEIRSMQFGLVSTDLPFDSIHSLDQSSPHLPVRLGGRVLAHPVASDGLVAISLLNGTVVLLSELDGRELGRLTVPYEIEVTPALKNGFLYVGAGKELLAFDLARFLDYGSGQEQEPFWIFESESGVIAQPVLADGNSIYLVVQTRNGSVLEAVSQHTGGRVWPEPIPLKTSETLPPVLIEGQLLSVTGGGAVSLIDVVAGRVIRTLSLGSAVDAQVAPFVIGDRMLVSDVNGNLAAIVVRPSGVLVNSIYSNRARISTVSGSKDYVAVGHLAGLTLLNSRGGVVWSYDTIESVAVTPVIAGSSIFAIDDSGTGLLFDVLRSNPTAREKLLSGEITIPPLVTRSRIVVANASGDMAIVPRL